MALTEKRILSRMPEGLELVVRNFAESIGARVVAYAPLDPSERAYCVLRGKSVNHKMREESLFFASSVGGGLRIEPVTAIEGHPCLIGDLIKLAKRADHPLDVAMD